MSSEQRPPAKHDHLSTTTTILGFQGWSLYTALTVRLFFILYIQMLLTKFRLRLFDSNLDRREFIIYLRTAVLLCFGDLPNSFRLGWFWHFSNDLPSLCSKKDWRCD